jgi:hypothetical protein
VHEAASTSTSAPRASAKRDQREIVHAVFVLPRADLVVAPRRFGVARRRVRPPRHGEHHGEHHGRTDDPHPTMFARSDACDNGANSNVNAVCTSSIEYVTLN